MAQLTARLVVALSGVLSQDMDVGTAGYPLRFRSRHNLGSGYDGFASEAATDTRMIAAGGSEDLDLAAGLVDPVGEPVSIEAVKVLAIVADDGNAHDILIGAAAADPVGLFADGSDVARVKPGGMVLFAAPDPYGYQLFDGAGLLRVANDGGVSAVTYTVIVLGAPSIPPPPGAAFVTTNGGASFITTSDGSRRVSTEV